MQIIRKNYSDNTHFRLVDCTCFPQHILHCVSIVDEYLIFFNRIFYINSFVLLFSFRDGMENLLPQYIYAKSPVRTIDSEYSKSIQKDFALLAG